MVNRVSPRNLAIPQNAVESKGRVVMPASPFTATVKVVYSDRNTCDLELVGSEDPIPDVPVLCKTGIIDDEIYGVVDLPVVGDVVLVIPVNDEFPLIIGSIMPYLHSAYSTSQTPVNSSSKAYTAKLLEANKESYRRVFKSGTAIEEQSDGTMIIETPSGYYIMIDEANSKIVMGANSNTFSMESGKVVINGNLEVLQ